MADTDAFYKNVVKHIVSMRLADLDGIKGEDVEQEYKIRLYDEFIGMVRLASVVCDVPYLQVFDDAVGAVCERMLYDEVVQAGEDEEIAGLT